MANFIGKIALCWDHPKYKAKRRPRVACSQCWTLYISQLKKGQKVDAKTFEVTSKTSFDGVRSVAARLDLKAR